ncbi:hypothetical protein PVAP13_5NG446000 [Panicum virgatum]|uniref:Uncharacterized protein n=1 Tax=Panicum virgatum TaxID=38727 RepID=A0A8T0S0U6_PANVG|nr:hypothetical protein PVAP13_5NG446000 [Panicum virgatum]
MAAPMAPRWPPASCLRMASPACRRTSRRPRRRLPLRHQRWVVRTSMVKNGATSLYFPYTPDHRTPWWLWL